MTSAVSFGHNELGRDGYAAVHWIDRAFITACLP